MLAVSLRGGEREVRRVLCLGAHADDIEIGCGGTVLALRRQCPAPLFHWVVVCATPERAAEARASARHFLGDAQATVDVAGLRDGYLPDQWTRTKEYIEAVAQQFQPDLIFTHYRDDRHQDHRAVSDLTWNTFRNHLILEYEIPKYDGDMGRPNLFVPLDRAASREKVGLLMSEFPSQRNKPWYGEETFWALLRLRGMECHAPEGYAEAFHCRKVVLDPEGRRVRVSDEAVIEYLAAAVPVG
ncbi:MAG: PIG-L family deacetylase [Candidatus Latescibacterota bacterium]